MIPSLELKSDSLQRPKGFMCGVYPTPRRQKRVPPSGSAPSSQSSHGSFWALLGGLLECEDERKDGDVPKMKAIADDGDDDHDDE